MDPVKNMSELLQQMPSLVSLSLIRLAMRDPTAESSSELTPIPDNLPSVTLPRLQTLRLEHTPSDMKVLLRALPEPRDFLRVAVLTRDDNRWSPPGSADHIEILDHVKAFWQKKSGNKHLPQGKIWTARFRAMEKQYPDPVNFFTFGTREEKPAGEPNVFYETQSSITQFDPLVGDIKTFHVSGDRSGPSFVKKDSGAEHLLDLDDVSVESFRTAKHLDAVEKWIKKRHAAGLITKYIQFVDFPEKIADKVNALSQRLQAASLVNQVVVSPGDELSELGVRRRQ
jgi:hypothetical protein